MPRPWTWPSSSAWRQSLLRTQPQSSGGPSRVICPTDQHPCGALTAWQWPVSPLRACEPSTVNLEEKERKNAIGASGVSLGGSGRILQAGLVQPLPLTGLRFRSQFGKPGPSGEGRVISCSVCQAQSKDPSVFLSCHPCSSPSRWNYHYFRPMKEDAELSPAKPPSWQGRCQERGPGRLTPGPVQTLLRAA